MSVDRLQQLDYLPAFYLHVPFCSSKCSYCDFFSLPGADESLQSLVTAGTLAQARAMLEEIDPKKIDSFYVGGGTPNSLPPETFRRLIEVLAGFAERFRPREWTVELNPEHITRDQLELLASAGVGRISTGIQSFSDPVLSLLGRHADRSQNLRALDLLRKHWEGDLNLDLITAIPARGIDDAVEDLEAALGFEPDHLSLYALTYEKGTKMYRSAERGEIRPLGDEDSSKLLLDLWRRLSESGYVHYEVSNFAKKGHESRHNLHYWHMHPYIGVGPGGVSTLPLLNGGIPVRLETYTDTELFLRGSANSDRFPCSAEKLRPDQFLLEYLMMGLRTRPGIGFLDFRRIFALDLQDLISDTIDRYPGFLEVSEENEFLGPTEQGMMFLDSILTDAAVEIGDYMPVLNWPPEEQDEAAGEVNPCEKPVNLD